MVSGGAPMVSRLLVRLSDLKIHVGSARSSEHNERDSGDTVTLTERQNGSVSVVHADCKGHGRPAKMLANFVARKAVGLIAAGARDGATVHADSDALNSDRHGQAPTGRSMISLDLRAGTLGGS